MTVQVFAVSVFFICFRECIETSIVVSVLLAFLKQTLGDQNDSVYKKLMRQVWFGVGLGLLIVVIIGAGMIGAFYGLQKDIFAKAEDLWEGLSKSSRTHQSLMSIVRLTRHTGIFSIIAAVIISVMGAALLRVNKLQDKWRVKLTKALESRGKEQRNRVKFSTRVKRWSEKYAMFLLPFVTVLREGLEAVVYIGGVSLGLPATSFPLPVVCGILAGCLVGYVIYRGGRGSSLQIFLIISTCFLYLVAAGLFSRGVWYFENYRWGLAIGGDAAETGSGPGSYDIRQSVWHVNCCNPLINGGGGWGIFNAVLGWQNSATYGSVISYNLYWLAIICTFVYMRWQEKRRASNRTTQTGQDSGSGDDANKEEVPASQVREVDHAKATENAEARVAVSSV